MMLMFILSTTISRTQVQVDSFVWKACNENKSYNLVLPGKNADTAWWTSSRKCAIFLIISSNSAVKYKIYLSHPMYFFLSFTHLHKKRFGIMKDRLIICFPPLKVLAVRFIPKMGQMNIPRTILHLTL